MNKSIWMDSARLTEFDRLSRDISTDVLIIGGGLCGLLCAYSLKGAGVDCVVVEGSRIASGTTAVTTAKITSQHGLIYKKLTDSIGYEKAQKYFLANEAAKNEYREICSNIDCDYETKVSFIYSLTDRRIIEEEAKAAEALKIKAGFFEDSELPFKIKGAVGFENQGQFNPLKFISHISKELEIYENTFIYDITPETAISDGGKIKYKKVIIATHFPFINRHGSYFLKLYQHRSYVSAYKFKNKLSGMYADENSRGISLRQYKDCLLIGGGAHRTGKQGGGRQAVDEFAKIFYPDAELTYSWAAQDCMSLDGIPYIGRYSAKTPNMYVASGFNKWGVTSAMAAANILRDMITGKHNDFADVFSPQRSIIKPQLFVNGIESAVNLLSPSKRRCSHLGCALKWNKLEHSWDCPCHGSRFDERGRVLENPAAKNIDIG